MYYPTASSIYEEIAKLAINYDRVKDNNSIGGMPQWPLLRDGKFSHEDGLARLELPEANGSETRKQSNGLTTLVN